LPVYTLRALPKGPVLGWSSFRRESAPGISSVENLCHIVFTTSGRSAIYQALRQLHLPPDSIVMVPTYHCPTMVAPILLAGHRPAYFGIRADGLPDVQRIDPVLASQARAMIVSHYFGLAQSLREVRQWCDLNGIGLIEDCAHCYFGEAGERPIGSWGDYCTASLSKFFPVPEAGLLGSATHAIPSLPLQRQGLKAQVKGWIDVLETAAKYKRLRGLNRIFGTISHLKRKVRQTDNTLEHGMPDPAVEMMASCDMARIGRRPLAASMLLRKLLPRGRIVARRQRNFGVFARLLVDLPGTMALVALPSKPVAPYVFPLWVDDADRVYQALRNEGVPVFRWDQIWPDTPHLAHDVGADWSRHVLQLLCHQDLDEIDIRRSAARLIALLQSNAAPQDSIIEKPCPL
jgi:perosamine synthetase